jgi:hypothetical protein
MIRDYSALMNLAVELENFFGFLTTEELDAQGKIQRAFNSARNIFAYDALKTGEPAEDVKSSIAEEMAEMERGEPEWAPIYAFVRREVFERIDTESAKKPLVRKIVRWTPAAIGVAVAIAYFSVRMFSGLDVSQPIETKAGIQQRAAAFARVVTYVEMEPTGYGMRSTVKALLRWPIEPSEDVKKGAQDFASLTLSGKAKLSEEKSICGGLIGGTGETFSEQDIELIQKVADYVQRDDVKWETPSVMTVLTPIKQAFPCAR